LLASADYPAAGDALASRHPVFLRVDERKLTFLDRKQGNICGRPDLQRAERASAVKKSSYMVRSYFSSS